MLNNLISAGGFSDILAGFWEKTGLKQLFIDDNWKTLIMIAIACVLVYLAIVKKFEPMLLLPIAFGMFIVNIAGAYDVLMEKPVIGGDGTMESIGLFAFLSKGVSLVIFPPIIFLGIGAMTDFGPMIANPKTMLLGAAAQIGIFVTFIGALLLGFTPQEAASIGIIGGADGPTAIYVTSRLASDLLPVIAIAAYSYMALIPIIQPPFMKLLTTKKERQIKMEQLRPVSKAEKIVFPLVVTFVAGILLPSALPLLGMLMLGNLFKESGVVDRLSEVSQNALINIVTIFLGICVGAKATGTLFLTFNTLKIVFLGLFAFILGTCFGILFGKLMCKLTGGKVNPLIGAAGVSAVPMAARVAQNVGRKENPDNYLLMHAMGPNVAGVIGSAIAAGVLLAIPF